MSNIEKGLKAIYQGKKRGDNKVRDKEEQKKRLKEEIKKGGQGVKE